MDKIELLFWCIKRTCGDHKSKEKIKHYVKQFLHHAKLRNEIVSWALKRVNDDLWIYVTDPDGKEYSGSFKMKYIWKDKERGGNKEWKR